MGCKRRQSVWFEEKRQHTRGRGVNVKRSVTRRDVTRRDVTRRDVTHNDALAALELHGGAPESDDAVLAARDERAVRRVGDVEHRLTVRHRRRARRKLERHLVGGGTGSLRERVKNSML